MGVPSFYRWLTGKYPNIVAHAVEDKGHNVDTSLPNPNGLEFDNLYLDMNGIIHPCFHPEDNLFPPVTYAQVYNNIFEYIDMLFSIVRPRKLLYMAIDGVAPRAKMNQQRARRFKTSKDNEIAEKEEDRLRMQYEMKGKDVLPKEESEVSDSNIITPGSLFMYRLSKELQSYIYDRMNNDPGWREIKVILSDANVPGEGEHKIMSFIRLQRTCPGYNPNTRHCLYGLDADLIMLALATHEVHFSILREDLLPRVENPICVSALNASLGRAETSFGKSRGWFKQLEVTQNTVAESSSMSNKIDRPKSLVKKPYQFLQVWILREYLELDLKFINPPKTLKEDFERTIDDFIFFCFFAGNDFLPHMPSLEINEGGIDLLMHVYKEEFGTLGGYLVDMQKADDKKGSFIKLKRVEKFILAVGKFEEQIFKKRSELSERSLRRVLAECAEMQAGGDPEEDPVFDIARSDRVTSDSSEVDTMILKNTKQLKEELKSYTKKISDAFKNGVSTDKVRLGAPGWKARYYKEKFCAESPEATESQRKALVEKYAEGLCWVLLYYFSGVASWDWFYPFHYGPFVSDMKGLSQTNIRFQKGSPFKPFDQLLAVLPSKSAHALPTAYQILMTDEDSNIIDFYPTDFAIDADGKRFQWQGICKLGFIEEKRLLDETKKLELELDEEEAKRNAETDHFLFLGSSSELGSRIRLLRKNGALMDRKDVIKIDDSMSGEINGFVSLWDDEVGIDSDDNVLCVYYKLPPYSLHIPRLLEGVNIPEKTVGEEDIMETQLWHEHHKSRSVGCRFPNQEYARKNVGISRETSSEAVHIFGGVGWKGRGRVSPSLYVENEHTRVPGQSWEFRNSSSAQELKDASTSRGESSYAYKSTKECKPLGYDRAEFRNFEDLRISDPTARQSVNSFEQPFGRARQVDGCFRQSYDGDHPRECSFSQPYRPPVDGCFRQSNEGDHPRDSSFRQPYRPPNAWSDRTYLGRNSNQEWRVRARASSVHSTGMSSSQTVPNWNYMGENQRYHNQGEPASFRAPNSSRGRGRYASNSSFDTSSFRGRGRYASNSGFDTSSAFRGRGRGFDASSAKKDDRW